MTDRYKSDYANYLKDKYMSNSNKICNGLYKNQKDVSDRKIKKKVKIDGKIFSSIRQASAYIGCSDSSLCKYIKAFNSSKLSEKEVDIKVSVTFTLQRIKDDE